MRPLLPAVLLASTAGRAEAQPQVIVEPSTPAAPERATIETDAARLTFGSVLQLDAANGGPRPGFSMHRARLSLDAEVERLQGLGGLLTLGVGDADAPRPLLDGLIRFRVVGRGGPNFGELQLGQRTVPISREVLRDAEQPFVDPAPALRLAPGRDVGVLYHLSFARARRRATVDVGLWNGEGAGSAAAGGSMTTVRLSAGAGDRGRARPGMDWGFGYALRPDVPSAAGSGAQIVLSIDGELRYRPLTVAAELLLRSHERGSRERGLFGWVGYQIIADTLELRARGEMLDDGESVERALTFGLTFYYLAPRLRLLIDYTRALAGRPDNGGRTVTSFLFLL